jgi:hypothetical protein
MWLVQWTFLVRVCLSSGAMGCESNCVMQRSAARAMSSRDATAATSFFRARAICFCYAKPNSPETRAGLRRHDPDDAALGGLHQLLSFNPSLRASTRRGEGLEPIRSL